MIYFNSIKISLTPKFLFDFVNKAAKKIKWSNPDAWISLTLLLINLAVFFPVLSHPFINYDDGTYITNNRMVARGFSWQAIQWAFTTTRTGDWQPLVWLSFMLNSSVFGVRPIGFHGINLLLHSANAVMVYLLFRKMTGRRGASFLAAVFFALHPLRVESVAWISERKDVLSGFFFLLTLWLYVKQHLEKKPWLQWFAYTSYVLAALSKPIVISLPVILLLFDY